MAAVKATGITVDSLRAEFGPGATVDVGKLVRYLSKHGVTTAEIRVRKAFRTGVFKATFDSAKDADKRVKWEFDLGDDALAAKLATALTGIKSGGGGTVKPS